MDNYFLISRLTSNNLSDTRVSKLISNLSKKKYVQVITNFQDTTRQIIRFFNNITEGNEIHFIDNDYKATLKDKDDNLFNCCYMVQGFYSDTPHIEVSVLKS